MKVSIIIPVYNVEPFLAQCLESALNQTLSEIEVIAVNDGSTDKSLNILDEYASKYDCLKIINQKNAGLSVARNEGIKVAKGEYLYFLDSDDYILNLDIIEYCYHTAKYLDLDIVTFDSVDMWFNGENYIKLGHTNSDRRKVLDSRVVSGESFYCECMDKKAFKYSVCLCIYKKEFLLSEKMVFNPGRIYEDVAFNIQTFIKAKKVLYIPYEFYFRRVREGSITSVPIDAPNIVSLIDNGNDLFEFYITHRHVLTDQTILYLYDAVLECYESALKHCSSVEVKHPIKQELADRVKRHYQICLENKPKQ